MVTAETNPIAWTAPPAGVRPAGMPAASYLAIGALLAAASVVFTFAPAFEEPSAAAAWTAFGVLGALAVAVGWTVRRQGFTHWIAAPATWSYYFCYRYGIGALVVYYWDQFPWAANTNLVQRFYPQGARQNLGEGCYLAILGGLGMCAGMLLPAHRLARILPSIRWITDEKKFRRNVALYLPVAMLMTAAAHFAPEAAQYLLSTLGLVLYVFVALIAYWLFTAQGAARHLWLAMLICTAGLSILLGTISGAVGDLLLPFPMMMVGYIAARRKLPRALLVAGLPAAFFFAFPYLTAYKHASDQPDERSLETRVTLAHEVIATTDYRDAIEKTFDRFIARMALTEFPAVYSRFYPGVYPYEEGRSLGIEFGSVIPRVLWPEKPEMSAELNKYARNVGIVRAEDRNSAVFDAVSEYYVNFGPAGVFLLCAVHGFYISLLYAWLIGNFGELIASVVCAGLFLTNLDFFGIGQILVTQAKILPVWLGILYILSRRGRAEPAA